MHKVYKFSLAVLVSFLGASAARAVSVPNVFSSNMVLQRGVSVPVWGWGEEGETVTVTFRDQKVSTKVKDGKWTVKLSAMKVGPAGTMVINGNNALTFTNVVAGEVWLASGQSNMEFKMDRGPITSADIPSCTNSMIRWLNVPNVRLDAPTNNIGVTWLEATPATMPSNSAVAWYFASNLQKDLNVPIGIIQSDWGGTPIEAWTKREVLESNPVYKQQVIDASEAAMANFKKGKPKKGDKAARKPWMPGELYNGMIAPIVPYAIQGAIWYQGEANSSSPTNAMRYHTLLPDMIKSWRADWKNDFTFLAVQLAPFETPAPRGDWPSIREAQLNATKILPKVGIAVITDIGEEHDIHPKNKPPVGARLALAARAITYGEKIEYSGPLYKSLSHKPGRILITFSHAKNGFKQNENLKGFTICGEDHKFVPAEAQVDGIDRIVVHSADVPKPVAVRYGWSNWMVVNVANSEGLPASPFRTDDFPLVPDADK